MTLSEYIYSILQTILITGCLWMFYMTGVSIVRSEHYAGEWSELRYLLQAYWSFVFAVLLAVTSLYVEHVYLLIDNIGSEA